MASLIAILRQMLELSSEKRPPSAKVICDKLKKINVSENRQALFIPLSLVPHIVPTIQPSSPKPGALLFLWQHLSPVNTVAWSPVDDRIASGEERGVVHILSMNEARDLSTYDAHRAAVTCLAWSPDGRRLASGDRRLTIHIWDMQTGKTLLIYRGHHRSKSEEQMITSLSWSPDGTRLASVSGYHTVLVWDASTGETLLRYAGHGKKALARAVAWSPDTQLIASLAESCHIWNPATGVTQTIHHAITQALSWAHDGRRLAFTSPSFLHKRFTLIKIYEVAEKRTTFLYTAHYAPIRSVAWSYNDRSIAVSSAEHISICDTTTGRRIYTYQEHTHPVSALDWCPYYPYIVSSSLDGIIRVWSTGL